MVQSTAVPVSDEAPHRRKAASQSQSRPGPTPIRRGGGPKPWIGAGSCWNSCRKSWSSPAETEIFTGWRSGLKGREMTPVGCSFSSLFFCLVGRVVGQKDCSLLAFVTMSSSLLGVEYTSRVLCHSLCWRRPGGFDPCCPLPGFTMKGMKRCKQKTGILKPLGCNPELPEAASLQQSWFCVGDTMMCVFPLPWQGG